MKWFLSLTLRVLFIEQEIQQFQLLLSQDPLLDMYRCRAYRAIV